MLSLRAVSLQCHSVTTGEGFLMLVFFVGFGAFLYSFPQQHSWPLDKSRAGYNYKARNIKRSRRKDDLLELLTGNKDGFCFVLFFLICFYFVLFCYVKAELSVL